jgi:hypothetical protein
LWSREHPCEPGDTPGFAVHDGRYHPAGGPVAPHVLDERTGAVVGSEQAGSTAAFDGDRKFYVSPDGRLRARTDRDDAALWEGAAADYAGVPLTVDGSVYVAGRDGRVDGYDQATGLRLWTSGPPATTGPTSVAGLAAAGGLLVVPAARPCAASPASVLAALPAPAPGLGDPVYPSAPPGLFGTSWTGYAANAAHDGEQPAESAQAPYTEAWRARRVATSPRSQSCPRGGVPQPHLRRLDTTLHAVHPRSGLRCGPRSRSGRTCTATQR